MSASTVRMVFSLALNMAPFALMVVVTLLIKLVFLHFFQKFPNFCVRVGFRDYVQGLRLGLGCMFLPSVVHSTAYLCITVTLQTAGEQVFKNESLLVDLHL